MKTYLLFCNTKRKAKWGNVIIIYLIFLFNPFGKIAAQCPGGYYQNTINWDNLDYLDTTGNYSGFVTPTMSRTQKFAIGTNYLTIARTTGITSTGENTTHTGEASSNGTGADVSFTGDGTITLTFNSEVQNVLFSLYDIDLNQNVGVTAQNASAVAQTVTLTTIAGTILTLTGSPGTSPTANDGGGATSAAVTATTGTVNVSIAGPVKTITITISTANATKDFWLSDIAACISGTFTNDYYTVMQPYTGQPTYVLATPDVNTVSQINISTGAAKMVFQDPSCSYINSMAYDPVNHILYYVADATGSASTNKTLKKYNFTTGTISSVTTDITTLGIPTFDNGVESAGASFYNGELFLGIEGVKSGHTGNRENIIWRISFDGSGNLTTACQVFGQLADNGGGGNTHSWSDFVVVDSMLIDFNGASSASAKYSHYNLRTENVDNTYTTGNIWNKPLQTGVTWNDQVYWIHDSIALYNGNGTIGSRTKITGPTSLDWTGFAGDASGFRPPSDFGDAPASYDPVALSPALHMQDTSLRLGAVFDQEFSKTSSALADADGSDEEAIASVNVLDTGTTNYLADIQVYNNTGANATLIGWLDIDGDGLFEASEAVTVTVPPGSGLQTITLSWMGINTPLVSGQITFLRIRLTSASNGMTSSNATGYFSNGEVEDYPVYVNSVLPVNLLSFTAGTTDKKSVKINWSLDNENNLSRYEIQRSDNGSDWIYFTSIDAKNISGIRQYDVTDFYPLSGKSYYRLKAIKNDNKIFYSSVAAVAIEADLPAAMIFPNPVMNTVNLKLYTDENMQAQIRVFNMSGFEAVSRKQNLAAGENSIPLDVHDLPAGIYTVRIETVRGVRKLSFLKIN